MLCGIERERIEQYSVWHHRQKYSDNDLWARLRALGDRELEILKQLPFAYKDAHGGTAEAPIWRLAWRRLLTELDASKPLMRSLAWHLEQRGDPSIADWLQQREQHKRANTLKWQRAAWRTKP